MSKRSRHRQVMSLLAVLAAAIVVVALGALTWVKPQPQIKVGIIHSQSGTLADSERLISYGSLLAIEELNRRGGVLGRRVEGVLGDGASDWPTFAREAARLIDEEEVSMLVGCYTSASRKEVKEVVEDRDHLLIYPMPYEGIEESENVFYTGATPNQQIIPAINWAVENIGAKKFMLVGSDYVWPRCVHAIVKDQIDAKGLTLLGEHYIYLGPSGSSEAGIAKVADEIAEQQPDMIINTLVGDGIEKLAVALKLRGISTEQCPVLAFAVTEVELAQLPPGLLQGGYTSWNYFQALNSANNEELVTKFRDRWPDIEAVNDGMVSAYHSVMLWAQAVEEAGTDDVDAVRRQLRWQSVDSPGGIISIDSQTNHAWRVVHIGRFEGDATIRPIWTSGRPVRPMPYPISRTRSQWVLLVENLHEQWGQWSNPVEERFGEDPP